MRQALLALVAIGLVASLAGAGTVAFFNDTETSEGNTFTAGTLDLKVEGTDDPDVKPKAVKITFDTANMKPGDGEVDPLRYGWKIKNAGTIAGKLWVEISEVINDEKGLTESELKLPDDATTGELGEYLRVRWGRCETGYWISWTMSGYPGWHKLNDISEKTMGLNTSDFPGYPFPVLGPGDVHYFVMEFYLPIGTGNIVQSDSVEFDIIFHLDQA